MDFEYNNNSGEGGSTTTTSEASVYNNIPLTVLDFFTKINYSNNVINNKNHNDTSLCYPSVSYELELSPLSSFNYLSTNYSGAIKN